LTLSVKNTETLLPILEIIDLINLLSVLIIFPENSLF